MDTSKAGIIRMLTIAAAVMIAAFFAGTVSYADSEDSTFTSYADAQNYVYEGVMDLDSTIEYTLVVDKIDDRFHKFARASVGTLSSIDDGTTVNGDYAELNNFNGNSFSYTYTKENGKYTVDVTEKVKYRLSKSQDKAYRAKLNRTLKKMHLRGSDKTKVRKIYKYITKHVKYDNNYNKTGSTAYTAYNALAKGRAVCNGYSALFYDMCRRSGVPCRIIVGEANGGLHAWNIVKIGSKWYNADATWDAGAAHYRYFLKSDKAFNKTHKRDAEYKSNDFRASYPMASKSL